MAAPDGAPPARAMGLLLATLIPAAAAAAAVLVITAAPWSSEGTRGSPAALALAAERVPAPRSLEAAPALRPLAAEPPPRPIAGETARVLRPLIAGEGSAGLEPSPLEPLDGGVRPAPPQRLAIPAAGIDAVVEPVTTRAGELEVPDVGNAGWYEGGARPGEPGRSVVIGHLDRRDGPGLFARVPGLRPGTRLTVTDRRGEVRRFTTVGVAQVRKDEFPAEFVYGSSARPVLVLVTCGGPYAKGSGYRDNVLLFARAA